MRKFVKQFLFMLLLGLFAPNIWSEKVDVTTARKVAENAISKNLKNPALRSSTNSLSLAYIANSKGIQPTLRSGSTDDADFFVFNMEQQKGFVIVSADNRVMPVLGISDKGEFDLKNIPDGLRFFLTCYQEEISYARKHGLKADNKIKEQWNSYLNNSSLRSYGEDVVIETAEWDQADPFNKFTPIDFDDVHTAAGCTPIALAIIMRHHRYPTDIAPVKAKGVKSHEGLPVRYEDYQWDLMPLRYINYTEEEKDAVSMLTWNLGANLGTKYGGSSSTFDLNVLPCVKDLFGYSKQTRQVFKDFYTWKEWKQLIKDEINNYNPVYYSGVHANLENYYGHSFVCDGYNDEEAFHFNWGWGGNGNGFYLLTALGDGVNIFSKNMKMILGMHAPDPYESNIIDIRFDDLAVDKIIPDQKIIKIRFAYHNSSSCPVDEIKMGIGLVNRNDDIMEVLGEMNGTIDLKEGDNKLVYLNCKLNELPPKSSKIIPIFQVKEDKDWLIMGGKSYINQKGKTVEIEDSNDPDERPVVVTMRQNDYDRNYIAVRPKEGEYSSLGRFRIKYKTANATNKNFIVRYTIENYDEWKGHISFTQNDPENFFRDIPVTINSNGSFDVIPEFDKYDKEIFYTHTSCKPDKKGIINYKAEVFDVENMEKPVAEIKNKQIITIEPMHFLAGSFLSDTIKGTVNQKVPMRYSIQHLDEDLKGQQASISFNFQTNDPDKIKLYQTIDGNDIEIKPQYINKGRSIYFRIKNSHIMNNGEFSNFKFLSEIPITPSLDNLYCIMELYVNNMEIPKESTSRIFRSTSYILFYISEKDLTKNENIETDDLKIWGNHGELHINILRNETLSIFDLNGKQIISKSLPAGESIVNLTPGIYIIHIGNKVIKIRI